MAPIKDTSVDEVKAAADMIAVVSGRTQLRKTGGRFLGRCPFHEERTPSFSVNATDKLYYCFGCGAKGDLITFVRETEQLDFAGAIEWLADRFNVQVEYEETSPEQDARRRPRARRDRQAGARRRGGGEHRRAGAEAGGDRTGGGVDGNGADRTPRQGARPADDARVALFRRRCRRRGCDLAGNGARGGEGAR